MKTHLGLKLRLLMFAPSWIQRKVMFTRYRDEVQNSGEKELLYLRNLIKPDSLAIDVGANLGVYSYELSRLGVRVICCEPNPDLAELLRSLRLPNVSVVEAAISNIEGVAELAMPRMRSGHVLSSLSHDVLEKTKAEIDRVIVATKRLDDLINDKVDFIKIDVEGHEEAVISGAVKLIKRDSPVLLVEIEERHNPGGITRIRTFMESHGYSAHFFFDDDWHSINEFLPEKHQNYQRAYENGPSQPRHVQYCGNFLFIPHRKNISLN